MQKWMASAAGGMSQRLNPGPAVMRCSAGERVDVAVAVMRAPQMSQVINITAFKCYQ